MKWRGKTICGEVIFAFEQCVDYIVNQRRINHRTIRGDADNRIRLRLFRGLIVTVKHVIETATRERDAAKVAVFRDRVVRGIGRCGEKRFGNGDSP